MAADTLLLSNPNPNPNPTKKSLTPLRSLAIPNDVISTAVSRRRTPRPPKPPPATLMTMIPTILNRCGMQPLQTRSCSIKIKIRMHDLWKQ